MLARSALRTRRAPAPGLDGAVGPTRRTLRAPRRGWDQAHSGVGPRRRSLLPLAGVLGFGGNAVMEPIQVCRRRGKNLLGHILAVVVGQTAAPAPEPYQRLIQLHKAPPGVWVRRPKTLEQAQRRRLNGVTLLFWEGSRAAPRFPGPRRAFLSKCSFNPEPAATVLGRSRRRRRWLRVKVNDR
jgi:hypothetical protein